MLHIQFEWDEEKDIINQKKHDISFQQARKAFEDPKRIIAQDTKQSKNENRLYCIGKLGNKIIAIRFTFRNKKMSNFIKNLQNNLTAHIKV